MSLPRVLLIDPPDFQWGTQRNMQLPLGLIALHNYLKSNHLAEHIEILDLTLSYLKSLNTDQKSSPLRLLENSGICQQHWDVIGLTTHFTNTLYSTTIAKYLKKKSPQALIVFGGVHATSCYANLLNAFPFIDIVILGEGEQGLGHLCKIWSNVRCSA